MKILDCTLRDGGYYNKWDFSVPQVNSYLKAITSAGIDFVEIGFRFTPKEEYLGPFAYSTDSFLKSLDIPEALQIGVMINLKDITSADSQIETLEKLFNSSSDSPVSLVRVACHYNDVIKSQETVRFLKENGYIIGLNIMQSSSCASEELTEIASEVKKWDSVDVLYYADSLGDMKSKEMAEVKSAIEKGWNGPIGVHTHNNMGQALDNSLWAIDNGVEWIDATLTGMGRGAGNAELELLLIEAKRRDSKYKADDLLDTLYSFFYPMKKEYCWGPNYFYYMAAKKQIHPTYVQQMLTEDKYKPNDILNAIEQLSKASAKSFSSKSLTNAFRQNYSTYDVPKVNEKLLENKNVLIYANDDNASHYIDAVEEFVKRTNSIVICLNNNEYLPDNVIDYYACSHPTRIAALADRFKDMNKPVILPYFSDSSNDLDGVNTINYAFKISNTFSIEPEGCSADTPLVGIFAISFALASGARNIYTIGFKGYGPDDQRQSSMNNFINHVNKTLSDVSLISLTPTTYNFKQGSIYAPWN